MPRSATVITRVRPTATESLPPIDPKTLEAGYVSHLLGPAATQGDCRAVIHSLKERFLCKLESVVIFAYGQTGAGKTHTILGPPGSLTEHALQNCSESNAIASTGGDGASSDRFPASSQIPQEWGLFPSTALEVFRHLPPKSSLKVSVVEVYMDRVYDLLNDRKMVPVSGVGTKQAGGLYYGNSSSFDASGKWVNPQEAKKMREKLAKEQMQAKSSTDTPSGTDLGLASTPITTEADVAKIARLIEATRTTVSHKMNERSSRSHCIITLKYATVNPTTSCIHSATFTFADLAGSERVKTSGVDADSYGGARGISLKGANCTVDMPASRFDEARNVNTSLASLSRLMVAMASATKAKWLANSHLPWRDSTLNLVLKDCFLAASTGGTGAAPNMVLLMAIREDASNEKETGSTYRFGKVVATTTTSNTTSGTGAKKRSKSSPGGTRRSVIIGMGSRDTPGGLGPTLAMKTPSPAPEGSPLSSSASTTTLLKGKGESLDVRMKRLRAERETLAEQLSKMEGTTDAGGVDKTQPVHIQNDFLQHQKALELNQRKERQIKQDLLEVKARLNSSSTSLTTPPLTMTSSDSGGAATNNGSNELRILQEALEEAKHQIWVQQGIVYRMINSGCYNPPSKRYVAIQKQLEQVEQQLTEFD